MSLKEEIENIIRNSTENELISNFTKEQLIEMYICVYQTKPLSNNKKANIASLLKRYFHQIDRVSAFFE